MNKIKLLLSTLTIVLATSLAPLIGVTAVSTAADYRPANGATCGANGRPVTDATGNTVCEPTNPDEKSLPEIVAFIINVFSWIVGAVSVIMIIYGGFRYILSQGEPDATKKAKGTIIGALIGLIVTVFAASIVGFVGSILWK